VADDRAFPVRAEQCWRLPRPGLWEAAELLSLHSACLATVRWLATYFGRDDLCARYFFRPHYGGTRAFAGRSRTYATLPWRGLSITFAFLLFFLAVRVYLGRFEQLFDGHTIFTGVTYSDAHVILPGMLIVCAALILGA